MNNLQDSLVNYNSKNEERMAIQRLATKLQAALHQFDSRVRSTIEGETIYASGDGPLVSMDWYNYSWLWTVQGGNHHAKGADVSFDTALLEVVAAYRLQRGY